MVKANSLKAKYLTAQITMQREEFTYSLFRGKSSFLHSHFQANLLIFKIIIA